MADREYLGNVEERRAENKKKADESRSYTRYWMLTWHPSSDMSRSQCAEILLEGMKKAARPKRRPGSAPPEAKLLVVAKEPGEAVSKSPYHRVLRENFHYFLPTFADPDRYQFFPPPQHHHHVVVQFKDRVGSAWMRTEYSNYLVGNYLIHADMAPHEDLASCIRYIYVPSERKPLDKLDPTPLVAAGKLDWRQECNRSYDAVESFDRAYDKVMTRFG